MSYAVMGLSDPLEHERNRVLDTRAAFQSAASSGCLGEIDGHKYLSVLDEYERRVRNSHGSQGTGKAVPQAPASSAAGGQAELEWIESERSRVLDCYGGILPVG